MNSKNLAKAIVRYMFLGHILLFTCVMRGQGIAYEKNNTEKTCLLIVDVQRGFINESTKDIPKKVEKLQYNYDYVFITKFYNPSDSFFRKLVKWEEFDKNSKDVDIAFKPKLEAIILEKTVYTCVNEEFLDLLKSLNINTVYICGIDTDICVTKSAVDLYEHNIIPIVLSSYCGSTAGKEAHRNALKTLERYIGKDQVR